MIPKPAQRFFFVSGFDGLGLHTLFSIIRLFGGIYKNFVFVEIGLIDAGNFKGEDGKIDQSQEACRFTIEGVMSNSSGGMDIMAEGVSMLEP